MTGLFIIAHAPLASALRATAMHAFPDAAQAMAVYDVPAGADTEAYQAEAAEVLAGLGCDETLILTDVFGATPCNIAKRLAEQAGVRVVAGVAPKTSVRISVSSQPRPASSSAASAW